MAKILVDVLLTMTQCTPMTNDELPPADPIPLPKKDTVKEWILRDAKEWRYEHPFHALWSKVWRKIVRISEVVWISASAICGAYVFFKFILWMITIKPL